MWPASRGVSSPGEAEGSLCVEAGSIIFGVAGGLVHVRSRGRQLSEAHKAVWSMYRGRATVRRLESGGGLPMCPSAQVPKSPCAHVPTRWTRLSTRNLVIVYYWLLDR